MNTLDQMINHLEFLGYQVDQADKVKEEDKRLGSAKQSGYHTLVFLEMDVDLILFRVKLMTERQLSPGVEPFINRANKQLGVSKVYYEVIDDKIRLVFEATYAGAYLKDAFGRFYNVFEGDRKRFISDDEASKLFL